MKKVWQRCHTEGVCLLPNDRMIPSYTNHDKTSEIMRAGAKKEAGIKSNKTKLRIILRKGKISTKANKNKSTTVDGEMNHRIPLTIIMAAEVMTIVIIQTIHLRAVMEIMVHHLLILVIVTDTTIALHPEVVDAATATTLIGEWTTDPWTITMTVDIEEAGADHRHRGGEVTVMTKEIVEEVIAVVVLGNRGLLVRIVVVAHREDIAGVVVPAPLEDGVHLLEADREGEDGVITMTGAGVLPGRGQAKDLALEKGPDAAIVIGTMRNRRRNHLIKPIRNQRHMLVPMGRQKMRLQRDLPNEIEKSQTAMIRREATVMANEDHQKKDDELTDLVVVEGVAVLIGGVRVVTGEAEGKMTKGGRIHTQIVKRKVPARHGPGVVLQVRVPCLGIKTTMVGHHVEIEDITIDTIVLAKVIENAKAKPQQRQMGEGTIIVHPKRKGKEGANLPGRSDVVAVVVALNHRVVDLQSSRMHPRMPKNQPRHPTLLQQMVT